MKKLVCDKGCQGEFILVEFGVGKVKDDIERVGFCCPHCDMQYTAYYTNTKIRKLQKEQQELLKQSDPRKLTERQLKGIMSRINNKKKQIKAEMDRLRVEVEMG